ncbi:MAG TPA: lysophospholipid acyltransferase family protein [Verrucomicrobiae bacterium]
MKTEVNPQPQPPSAGRQARIVGGVVVPHPPKWHQRLLAVLFYAVAQGVTATLRFRLEDLSGYFSDVPQEKYIFVIWHNRLALSLIIYRRYVARRDRKRRLVALVSASKDGGLLTAVLEMFKVQPVRGSSSRRGAQALREMVAWGRRGHDLALTPDGPRGPCYVVQEGVISAAQMTGMPIVPVTYHLNWKFRVKSWDRFQIPLPFAVCTVTMGQALRVPHETDAAGREKLRLQLEADLHSVTRD